VEEWTLSAGSDRPGATRDTVLGLLRNHVGKTSDAHEAAMLAATLAFVETEPNCAERTLAVGHLTGSAWIVDATRTRTLLTHHRKLHMWLQLGGHADGDLDLAAVAFREAQEESGLTRLRLVSGGLFDVDRHRIPARTNEPEHWHYDLRFMVEADPAEPFVVSEESHDLAWIEIARMAEFNGEESMLRMARKTLVLNR
jgi:8-oxo-dGTP pyrophosphatase MutT (NUDIX family)